MIFIRTTLIKFLVVLNLDWISRKTCSKMCQNTLFWLNHKIDIPSGIMIMICLLQSANWYSILNLAVLKLSGLNAHGNCNEYLIERRLTYWNSFRWFGCKINKTKTLHCQKASMNHYIKIFILNCLGRGGGIKGHFSLFSVTTQIICKFAMISTSLFLLKLGASKFGRI